MCTGHSRCTKQLRKAYVEHNGPTLFCTLQPAAFAHVASAMPSPSTCERRTPRRGKPAQAQLLGLPQKHRESVRQNSVLLLRDCAGGSPIRRSRSSSSSLLPRGTGSGGSQPTPRGTAAAPRPAPPRSVHGLRRIRRGSPGEQKKSTQGQSPTSLKPRTCHATWRRMHRGPNLRHTVATQPARLGTPETPAAPQHKAALSATHVGLGNRLRCGTEGT